jgi:tRNA(Arg) A34 adenosine deaminase TadA
MALRDDLVRRAIVLAREAREAGDHPFGALLAVDGEVLAQARNRVTTSGDLTAHAETELVREVERAGLLPRLSDGLVVASTEPCPMCMGALFWAGARHIVFGLRASRLNRIATAPDEVPYGFTISAAELAAATTRPPLVEGPFLEDEAAAVHDGFWFQP